MIDLKKPIRHKEKLGACLATMGHRWVLVEWQDSTGGAWAYKADEFERFFENIPEPRKPREWEGFLTKDGGLRTNGRLTGRETIRIIEWPYDAPLPDWPEP